MSLGVRHERPGDCAAYATQAEALPALDEPPWPQPLSLSAFASLLGGATQWLCPATPPIGFVIGAHGWDEFKMLWEKRVTAGVDIRFK